MIDAGLCELRPEMAENLPEMLKAALVTDDPFPEAEEAKRELAALER